MKGILSVRYSSRYGEDRNEQNSDFMGFLFNRGGPVDQNICNMCTQTDVLIEIQT